MNQETIKFCKDCRYYMEKDCFGDGVYVCKRNLVITKDRLSGKQEVNGYLDARSERYSESFDGCTSPYCGKEAKFWEPKES